MQHQDFAKARETRQPEIAVDLPVNKNANGEIDSKPVSSGNHKLKRNDGSGESSEQERAELGVDMLKTIAGLLVGGWLQQLLMVLVCITIIVMMVFGAGIEVNVNSKNWIKESVRIKTRQRIIDRYGFRGTGDVETVEQ